MSQNKNIVLIMGKPNTGKSTSLMSLTNQNRMVYMNCDLKALPFRDTFLKNVEVADAMDVLSYVTSIEQQEGVDGAVLDTLTFLMSMYERQYVATATNGQAAWGAYANFYKELIHAIKAGTKDYAIFAHADTTLNEQEMQYETRIPLKGSVAKTGVEADFTTILGTRRIPLKQLEGHANDLLHITDEEKEDGSKCVFVTRVTKETVGDKMRSAMGLWKRNELYIDNNLDHVFKRLKEYYA